jgi:hypothetical protein
LRRWLAEREADAILVTLLDEVLSTIVPVGNSSRSPPTRCVGFSTSGGVMCPAALSSWHMPSSLLPLQRSSLSPPRSTQRCRPPQSGVPARLHFPGVAGSVGYGWGAGCLLRRGGRCHHESRAGVSGPHEHQRCTGAHWGGVKGSAGRNARGAVTHRTLQGINSFLPHVFLPSRLPSLLLCHSP